jgi:ADP-heptose:LPS heptosyltransferase
VYSRIVLVLPCCIGDVVMATATLAALRRAYPGAHITWAVGRWSKPAIEHHPMLNAILDTGTEALPVRTPRGMLAFVRQLHAGHYDLMVSLVRSPLMSVAALLSGIPTRAGLDSGGRGFGYTVRAKINPATPRHEAEIYLDVARALGLNVAGLRANTPVREIDRQSVRTRLAERGISGDYLVLNPAGGSNPGMVMDIKRWPPEHFSQLGNRLASRLGAQLVLLGGPKDTALIEAVQTGLSQKATAFVGELSFGEITALAHDARVYIGNDTGLTHLAAAVGARTAMIFGPTDPSRYAPFADRAIALWRPAALPSGGVASGTPLHWDWARDGISVDEAEARVLAFLDEERD